MKPSRKLFTQLCLVLGIVLFVPSISAASNMEQGSEHTCEFSAWDLGNYPPSNLEEAQALERNANCRDDGICSLSVWDLGNYPPSSVLDAHASSEIPDCSEGDICQVVAGGGASLNLAPYSGRNAHSISEDRMEAATVAENLAPWSTRDAHSISEDGVMTTTGTCDVCVTVHGFGAQTAACDLAWKCDSERISDPQIPTEVLRQAEYASDSGC